MQCKSLIATLLALSIVFTSAAPLPDTSGELDADVESIGIRVQIDQSPSIINRDRPPSPGPRFNLLKDNTPAFLVLHAVI
ncbi:hypothetical protein EDD18DRAFT_1359721 [Armillaria luteobubalina]|uniref:Uncharacterized protein n=1 Tax=Armillaria luteobubalina TaxID=153913 RepID=A0AA39UGC0_9AGAR|nr:hypothetical protein EDD18DRAFT_1359721 [Armillaria luteobubalina]